jgi:LysM repeat protein
MLHRNTLIAISALFCAIAVGAGLFVADMSRQGGVTAQPPGLSGTSQPPAAATQPTAEADTPTATNEPVPTSAPAAELNPTEPPATRQPEPTSPPDATTPPSSTAEYIEYTVQKGDLLNSIAKKYNVTAKDILAINEIANADSLTVGQVLRIPRA